MTNDSLNALTLLRERIKCQKDSRYDGQFIELLDILITMGASSGKRPAPCGQPMPIDKASLEAPANTSEISLIIHFYSESEKP